jgi:hemolysin-activating ACP:hemolysin acyltransferase
MGSNVSAQPFCLIINFDEVLMSYSLSELLACCGKVASPSAVDAITIGLALPALAELPVVLPHTLAWHMDRLVAAQASQQIGLCFDRFGQLCGCALWACVTPAVSDRLLQHGTDSLLPAEVRGGDETWIMELFVRHGELPLVLTTLRDDWLRGASRVTYFRTKRSRRIAKRVSRTDPLSFFRRPPRVPSHLGRYLQTKGAESLRHSAAQVLDAALELGEVAQLVRLVPSLAGMPLPLALARLRVPMNHLQRRLYRQADGALAAYLAWAWLDDTLISSGVPAPQQLAPFQWNEGRHLVLCDAIARPAGLSQVADDLAHGLFPPEPTWLRTNHDAVVPSPARRLGAEDLRRVRASPLSSEPAIDLLEHLQAARGVNR